MSLCPLETTPEHFFRTVGPDAGCGRKDRTDSGVDGDAVPGLANAESVNLPRTQSVYEKRRRYHDQPHFAIGVDSCGREPVTQLVVVAGEWIDHPECKRLAARLFAIRDHSFQRRRVS